jgi:hypothetical protein
MALTYTQLASITHELIVPKAVDNIFNSNPLLFRFKERGIKYDGGRDIVQPLVYATTNAVQAYEGSQVLSTEINDNLTAAVYNWRQYSAFFGVTGREELINNGKNGIVNLLKTKQKVCELSLLDKLGTDLQASNSSGVAIDGLGLTLSTSSTYGGIATADMSTWAAKNKSLSVAGTLTLFELQQLQGKATIGADSPTVFVTRQQVYDKIWSLVQPDQRFVDATMANAGFGGIKFNGKPIVVDSHVTGSDGGTQDNWVEALNEAYIGLAIHQDVNFKTVPIPQVKDQDVKMVRIFFAGNLWCSARRMQGFISTIDPAL